MVTKKIILLLLGVSILAKSYSQNSFLDEINFLDNQRNFQLKDDSLRKIENSLMIRSTSSSQYFYNQFSKSKSIIKSMLLGYDFQNNSLLPVSMNDGLLYPSRGWQERYTIGINLNWKILDINFQPEKILVQNLKQEYYDGNPGDGNFIFKYFGMVANHIDHFRQFGYEKIDTNSFGQSRIGIKTKFLSYGYSTENIWWGPGKRNSLVFTNNAGGFRHFYFNSASPIKSNIGSFEFSAIAGTLDTTKFTDIDQELLNVCQPCKVYKNLDQRKIDAITINWSPKWTPNFYLGYAYSRQYYAHQKNEYKQSYTFFSKDKAQQFLGALMFRFTMPKDHAEFYGEIGLPNDAPYPWKFFKERARTGFVFGSTKLFFLNKGRSFLNLNIEFTQLQLMDPRNVFFKGYASVGGQPNSWYQDINILQGYSNNGQLMGSFIGPGSNNQSISLSWQKGYNRFGIFLERTAHNNDFYSVGYITPFTGTYIPSTGQVVYGYYNRYWVDFTKKIEIQIMPIKYIFISASFSNTNAMNYRWIRYEDGSLYDEPSKLTDKYNQQFQLSIKYLFNVIIK